MTKNFSPAVLAQISKAKVVPRHLLPQSEEEIQLVLQELGIEEPKPGRPRKGAHSETVLVHARLPRTLLRVLRRKAVRKHVTLSKAFREACAGWALAES